MDKLETKPTEITLVYVQAILMPNGELISDGKTLGYWEKLKRYIFIQKK